jgi:hypothetical protein
MTARPVPLPAESRVVYAVMTADPIGAEDLIPPPSPELLRRYGTSENALHRLGTRHRQHLLMRTSPREDAAATQRDVRIEALRLAAEHDGVVIDLAIPRAVEDPADAVSLSHATQWYVVDYTGLDAGRLRTVGLASFGLPEVEVAGVVPQQHAMFSAVLAGLVHRLIAEWPAHDPVGDATITLRDIAYGLGDPGAADTPGGRQVGVTIGYNTGDALLTVRVLDDPGVALFA